MVKELTESILMFLEFKDICRSRRVSKEYNEIYFDLNFWERWTVRCTHLKFSSKTMLFSDLLTLFKPMKQFPVTVSESFLIKNDPFFCKEIINNFFVVNEKVKITYNIDKVIYPSKSLYIKQRSGKIPCSYLEGERKVKLDKTILLDLNDENLEKYKLYDYGRFMYDNRISYKLKNKYDVKFNENTVYKLSFEIETQEEFDEFIKFIEKTSYSKVYQNLNENCNPDLLLNNPDYLRSEHFCENKRISLKHLEILNQKQLLNFKKINFENCMFPEFFLEKCDDRLGIREEIIFNKHLTYDCFKKYKKDFLTSLKNISLGLPARFINYLNGNENIFSETQILNDEESDEEIEQDVVILYYEFLEHFEDPISTVDKISSSEEELSDSDIEF